MIVEGTIKMWNGIVLKTLRWIASVILLTGLTAVLGGLSCYGEVAMPVIVGPIEDVPSGKRSKNAINDGQDAQGLYCLPEDQTEDLSESKKNAASNSRRESITAERQKLYQFH